MSEAGSNSEAASGLPGVGGVFLAKTLSKPALCPFLRISCRVRTAERSADLPISHPR
jgi:hypothetical protein